MTDFSAFPITRKWPAANPEVLQYYGLPTPNGVKVSIMLEEIGLPYEAHLVDFAKDEQKSPEFLTLNPNGKIPAIIDPDGPGGKPIGLFESGAILLYLADKTGKLMPADPAARWETIAVADVADGRARPDVRAARLLQQIRRARTGRTSARATATSPRASGCSACSTRGSAGGRGSWATSTRSPTSRRSAGCAT